MCCWYAGSNAERLLSQRTGAGMKSGSRVKVTPSSRGTRQNEQLTGQPREAKVILYAPRYLSNRMSRPFTISSPVSFRHQLDSAKSPGPPAHTSAESLILKAISRARVACHENITERAIRSTSGPQ